MTREAVSVEVLSASVRSKDWRPWLLCISAGVITLDRLTKQWVDRHIEVGNTIGIIPHVFRISHVLNSGAAFSLFTESNSPERVRLMLIGFSILMALAVLGFLFRLGRRLSPTTVALALVLGGALGNLYDRVRFGEVIDFLAVQIIHYHWPDFNVADSAIVTGAMLLLLDAFRTTKTPSGG